VRQIRFTKEGYEKLKKENEDLLSERRPAVEDLRKARDMGDLSENGYYKSAKSKLSLIDRRLRIISSTLKHAVIIDDVQRNVVAIGSTVTLSDGEREITYAVVGDLEANPDQGKISLMSPLGKAIEGKKNTDVVNIQTPTGNTTYTIINIA